MKHLAQWNLQRRQCAALYANLLAPLSDNIGIPFEPEWSRAVYHLYVVRHADRDALQAHLGARGIGTGIHYPIPLHLQKAYKGLGYTAGDFPVSEKAALEMLSLPMFAHLQPHQQHRAAEAVAEFVESRRPALTLGASAGHF